MAVKRPPAKEEIDRTVYKQQLDYLYARRSVLDSLISSLEDYDRFPVQTIEIPELKTA